jgi:hypothetical protein
VALQGKKVMALHWKNEEDVLMSTMHNAEMVDVNDQKMKM